jgi:hypothetical protein
MRLTTKPPFRFYVWIAIALAFTLYLFFAGMVLWGALFYGVFGIMLLYWVVSGKDCRIALGNDSIAIKFHKTFWRTDIHQLEDIVDVEFIQGDPTSKLFFISDKIERYYRSMDKIIFIHKASREEVLINANRADLQMLISEFRKSRIKT